MALPTYVGAGAMASGVGAITPPLPASPATDDILLLVVETRSGQSISIPTPNGGTWTQWSVSPFPDTGGTTGTRLTIFWSRYNGTQGDPTTSDSGNHQIGAIFAFRGCIATGDPADVFATGTKTTASTTVAVTGATTTVIDCLVVVACARENDAAGAHFSNYANADLANLTERFDNGAVDGDGGGFFLVTGEKASAGAYGDTTADISASVVNAFQTVALKPPSGVTETPTPGGVTVGGNAPLAVAAVTAAGVTVAGVAPIAMVPVAAAGVVVGGFDAAASATATPTPGGVVVGGQGPTALVPVSPGGSTVGGTGPTAVVLVGTGGVIVGGNPPTDSSAVTETPTPGGVVIGGSGPSARVTTAAGGVTVGGNAPTPAAAVAAGGVTAGAGSPSAVVIVSSGGVIVGGFSPTEIGAVVRACVVIAARPFVLVTTAPRRAVDVSAKARKAASVATSAEHCD